MAKNNARIIYSDKSLREEIEDVLNKLRERGYTDATLADASFIVANKSKNGILADFQIKNLMRQRRGVI